MRVIGRSWLCAGQHQAITGETGAGATSGREGCLPNALSEIGLQWIHRIATGNRFAFQGTAQPGQVAREEIVSVFGVKLESRERGWIAAIADAKFRPAITDQVQHDGVLGHPDRQLQRQRYNSGAETDARRLPGNMAEKYERRRQSSFVLMEMVLRHPGGVEAGMLGVHDLLGRQAIAFRCRSFVEQTGEECEVTEVRERSHWTII